MDSELTIAPTTLVQTQQAEQLGMRAKAGKEPLTDARRQELTKIAQDFEAIFTGMMLKAMRDTVPEDSLTGGGRGEDIYRSLLDQQYATLAAHHDGGLGIAAMMEKELFKNYAVPQQAAGGKPSGDDQ